MKAYPNLSKPITIGCEIIKNRMFMAPMDTGFGNNAWGGFTSEGVEYFVRRAEGGYGLLFSGGTTTDCKVYSSDCCPDNGSCAQYADHRQQLFYQQ